MRTFRRAARIALLFAIIAPVAFLAVSNARAASDLLAEGTGALRDPQRSPALFAAYWGGRPPARFPGDDFLAAVPETTGQPRLGSIAGYLMRELAGDAGVEDVLIPGRPADDPHPRVVTSAVNYITRGAARTEKFDADLDPDLISQWRAEGRLVEYPHGVVVLVPESGHATRFVLHSDADRILLYVVPAEDSPVAERR